MTQLQSYWQHAITATSTWFTVVPNTIKGSKACLTLPASQSTVHVCVQSSAVH